LNCESKNSDNFSISPKYNVNHWIEAYKSGVWKEMVEIFSDRLEGRFLEPIRLIAADEKIGKFSGFSIVTLDCLMIETLKQFYDGEDKTEMDHATAFRDFFRGSPYFQDLASTKKAKTFYSHFRCGLMHQAQTKKKSLIKIKQRHMVQQVSSNIDDGLIIDRVLFHQAIEDEINRYKSMLINCENEDMRKNFKKKMNIICNCT